MARGFGIPATPDKDRAKRIAAECERLGYRSIWTNDVPKANGLRTVRYMADATEAIRLCVGVVPLDRRPASEVVRAVRELELPLDRLVLGVGAGQAEEALDTVEEGIAILRDKFGDALKIAVAAMGPQMCRLAGRLADVVLFNWMTPRRIPSAAARVTEGEFARETPVEVERAAYVRVALDPRGADRIADEAARYAKVPVYAKNFQTLGVPLDAVGVAALAEEIPASLAAYDRVLGETIVRALPALDTVDSTLAVAEAAAPAARDAGSPE